MRRQLIGSNGEVKGILKAGERKSIQSDRVILIPGPNKELAIVREIFKLFTVDRKSEERLSSY